MSTVSLDAPARPMVPPPAGPVAIGPRLDSVDLVRGIIMVVMALDHTREYLTYLTFSPETLARTWPALFFTRWVTHFCAPLFFFLAGTGAYLARMRGRSISNLSHFLWTRGLWLVVLELTVVGLAWMFYPWGMAGVIWALGWSMVIMALVVRLPVPWVAAFGLSMIVLHNLLLDPVKPAMFGKLSWLWIFLHSPGFIPILPQQGILLVLYVLVPWVGVMAAGYAFGALYTLAPERRRKLMVMFGLAAVVLFLLLRATNFYGNPAPDPRGFGFPGAGPFVLQDTLSKSVISFLNVAKYPPSLQFLLMALGPGILALAAFDQLAAARNRLVGAFVVFGRVPLFYYVLHIYLVHLVAILSALAFGQPVKRILTGGFMFSQPEPGYGHHLPYIYFAWVLVNVLLYFPCRWYAEYKRTHRAWWLSYL